MFKNLLQALLGSKIATWLSTRALNPGAKDNTAVDKVLGQGVAEAIEGEAAAVVTQEASSVVDKAVK